MRKTENIDSLYKLNLNDKNSIIIDDSGKSIACFAVNENVLVDKLTRIHYGLPSTYETRN